MSEPHLETVIWWLRRDLRLHDNEALFAANQKADRVIPVFILDPALLNGRNRSDRRQAFLQAGLRALADDIAERGGRLIIRQGQPAAELARLVKETGASGVFAEEDHSPYARYRDAQVAEAVPLTLVGSSAIRPPGTVLKDDGTPYVVFTPFSRTWLNLPLPQLSDLLPAPERFAAANEIVSEPIPDDPGLGESIPFTPGEHAGLQRLEAFIDGKVIAYETDRDVMAVDGTSGLSPYLRFGMVSPRQAAATAIAARREGQNAGQDGAVEGLTTWINELIWRDFYIHILYHFPYVARKAFRSNLRNVQWRNDRAMFDAWCEGRTGYPVVDAAMRQLESSGWMHNRARMIVASFLVKDLLIDWRWGERWFMRKLVDGDLPANNGGWQWSAGTGTDAAPYFRIFNPTTQGKKFDPDGAYIRRWVPELASLEPRYLHEPSKMPAAEQRRCGCVIGVDYPAPIVDHSVARRRALDTYAAAKDSAE